VCHPGRGSAARERQLVVVVLPPEEDTTGRAIFKTDSDLPTKAVAIKKVFLKPYLPDALISGPYRFIALWTNHWQ
jgi:hypothetical protein